MFQNPPWAASFRYGVLIAVCLLTLAYNAWSAPNVIQILVDPVGGLVALTEDKGGLFCSNDGHKERACPKPIFTGLQQAQQKRIFL